MTPRDYIGLHRFGIENQKPARPAGEGAFWLSRRKFLVLGSAATASTALGVGTNSWRAAAATPQVDLTFEAGSLGPPITYHAGASVGAAYAHSGSYGCRLNPATTSNGVACLEVNQQGFTLKMPYATYSMYFRLVTLPKSTDSYMNLFEIGNTSTASAKSQFTVSFKNDRLVCDFAYDEVMDIGPTPAVGEWHMIQAIIYYGATTYTAQVSYDGGPTKTLTSARNKTAETVKALWVHYPDAAVDYIVDVDDIQMATSSSKPGFVGTRSTTDAATSSSAATFTESFERGAVGTKPTSANTAYDQSIGDQGDGNGAIAVVFDANGYRGHCARFYNTTLASNAFGFLGKHVNRPATIYLRRYYKIDVLPAQRTSVLLYKYGGTGNGQLGGTHNGSLAIGGSAQSHRFTLVNNNSNTTTSKATVPVNTWFRTEVKLDFTSGAGLQTVRLFLGSNVKGTTPSETITAALTGSYTEYLEDGILTNPGTKINIRIDEAVNGTAWIGPA